LLGLLRRRFGRVPRELRERILATTDVKRLKECLYRGSEIQALDELPL
jgi:hypothetical protein